MKNKEQLRKIIKEMVSEVLDEVSYWNPDEKDHEPAARAWVKSIQDLVFRKLADPMLEPEMKKTLTTLKMELDKLREGALVNLYLNIKGKKDRGEKVTPGLILSAMKDKWAVNPPMNEGKTKK